MIYAEYMMKAKDIAISFDDDSQTYYLEPEWKTYLYENELGDLDSVSGAYPLTWFDVEDVLRLEVERLNKKMSKINHVVDWVYDLISQNIDPMMMQEETEYVANVLEYLKFRAEHPSQTFEEEPLPGDEKIKQLFQSGMSFSKKE